MDAIKVTFKKDKFWKRFVRFNINEKNLSLDVNEKTDKASTKGKPDSGFWSIQRTFISLHEVFFVHFPFQTAISEIHLNQLVDGKLRSFCKEHGRTLKKTSQLERYEIPAEHLLNFVAIVNQIIPTSRTAVISLNSAIMQLSGQFDILISNIVAAIIRIRPEILDSSDRKIEYADLYSFDSLDSLKAHFSEKFVEGLIRRSRTEQFSWFANTLKTPTTKELDVWEKFIEINERRNLLTHSGGIVSSAYLKNCRDAGCKLPADIKIGQTLGTDLNYFKEAAAIFFEVGIKLTQVVWRKIVPEEIGEADEALVSAGFDLITKDRIPLALEVHRFANDVLKNVKSERHKRVLLVNYANCYNLLDKTEEAVRILSRMDWSASDTDFQVCVAAVSGETEKVISQMRKAVAQEILGEEEFRTWPVFRKMHNEKKFKDAYKDVFGKELISSTSSPKIDLRALTAFVKDWKHEERVSPEAIKQIVT